MNPGPFFYTDNTTYSKHCSLSLQTLKTGEIDNLTVPLGQSSLVVLCAGSTLLLTPVVRSAKVSSINLQKYFLPPTGRFNLGFVLREDLLLYSSNLNLEVSQRAYHLGINKFSGAVAGEEEDFCKGSLSLPISLLCFCFA